MKFTVVFERRTSNFYVYKVKGDYIITLYVPLEKFNRPPDKLTVEVSQ